MTLGEHVRAVIANQAHFRPCHRGKIFQQSWFPGEVTERPIVPDSKSGVPQGTGGSNPSLSADSRRSCRVTDKLSKKEISGTTRDYPGEGCQRVDKKGVGNVTPDGGRKENLYRKKESVHVPTSGGGFWYEGGNRLDYAGFRCVGLKCPYLFVTSIRQRKGADKGHFFGVFRAGGVGARGSRGGRGNPAEASRV